MDTQIELFRHLNQSETNSSQTIACPLIDKAKQSKKLNLPKEEIIRLYVKEKLSPNIIARLFKCSRFSIVFFLKRNNVYKLQKFTKCQFLRFPNCRINPEIANIYGHLISDGCIYNSYYRLVYSNTDFYLVKSFGDILEKHLI